MLAGQAGDLVEIVGQRFGRRHHRHIGGDGHVAGRDLVAEVAHGLGGRPDEGQAGLDAGIDEFRAFAQKAVAGMDGVGAGQPGDADIFGDLQIGLDRAESLADQVGLVGLEAVQRQLVFLGKDGDGA